MGFFSKLVDIAGGGLADKAIDLAKAYFPPDMNPEDVAKFEIDMAKLKAANLKATNDAANEAEKNFNARLKSHEGTAKDLNAMGWFGKPIIFMRGAQRPIWGFATMYMDFQVFSGAWVIPEDSQTMSVIWIINLLVLGFLFGERAIKNLQPVIESLLKK